MPDVVVVGAGPNGLAAAITVRRGRPLGARARGRRHDRRRHPHRRADAARVPPRRVLGDPPAGRRPRRSSRRPASTATASSWSSPRSPRRTRSTTAGPGCCTGRSRPRSPASGATARRGTGTSAGRPAAGTSLAPAILAPLAPGAPPPARRWRASGCAALPPATVAGRTFPPTRRRAVRGRRGALVPPAVAPVHHRAWRSCSSPRATSPAGPRRAAGRRRSPTPWPQRARRARRHDRDRPAGALARPTCPSRGRCCSTSRPASCCASAATRCPSGYRRRLRPVPLRPGRVQGRLRAVRAGAVDEPRRAGGPARCTSAARCGRSPTAEADVAAGRHPARPFVLVAQQSLFDPSRAPAGQHTLWAYCHAPGALHAST